MPKQGAKKTALITGTSSGFGKATAKLFAKKGWNVVATMRRPEAEKALVGLDNIFVTSEQEYIKHMRSQFFPKTKSNAAIPINTKIKK
ncbi:MAG: hypothetical protein QOH31_35 [Verrucomicrobiota bacterium]